MQTFSTILQPQTAEDYQSLFQQSYIDPAMKALQQQILPAVQQRFVDANAGSSSALNQALSQSATDLATQLGSQMGGFMQGQQGLQSNLASNILGMTGQQTFQPYLQQQQGWLMPLLQSMGGIGSAAMGNPMGLMALTRGF